MSVVRYFKGKALAFAYQLFPVRPLARSGMEKDSLERESRKMQLYFCHDCPSSLMIQRYCQRLGLRVVKKNVAQVIRYRNELINGGGQSRVPCLRVEEEGNVYWLYSREKIKRFLAQRF